MKNSVTDLFGFEKFINEHTYYEILKQSKIDFGGVELDFSVTTCRTFKKLQFQTKYISSQQTFVYKNFFTGCIAKYFEDFLKSAKFRKCLKLAFITPVFKTNARTSKNNYRPVLPVISKIFERIICNQRSAFLKRYFQSFNVVSVRAIAPNIVYL